MLAIVDPVQGRRVLDTRSWVGSSIPLVLKLTVDGRGEWLMPLARRIDSDVVD